MKLKRRLLKDLFTILRINNRKVLTFRLYPKLDYLLEFKTNEKTEPNYIFTY